MFGHDWQPAEGTVVNIRFSGQHGTNQRGAEPHFLMDVRPSSGEPFRTEVDELPLMPSFRPPAIGATVKLECDPGRKKARFIRDDPAISKKTAQNELKAQYEADRLAPPSPSAPSERTYPPMWSDET